MESGEAVNLDLSVLDRHERIAVSASGGKDSTAVVYLLRDHLHRCTVYTLDTGDLLPEMLESIARIEAMAPNFVRVRTDVGRWIDDNGLPSDLVPHSQHPTGRSMGEATTVLVHRYQCCNANLSQPLFDRIRDDGCTLLIRGTKRCDMNHLPVTSGEVQQGVELYLPLLGWSHEDVFAYLRSQGVELPRIYSAVVNSPECGRCPAWWGERRASYLKEHYPEIYTDYRERMQAVTRELYQPMRYLAAEIAALGGLHSLMEMADG